MFLGNIIFRIEKPRKKRKRKRQKGATVIIKITNHKILIVKLNLFILQWRIHQIPPNLPLLGCNIGAMFHTHCLRWFTQYHLLSEQKSLKSKSLWEQQYQIYLKKILSSKLRCYLCIIYHIRNHLRLLFKEGRGRGISKKEKRNIVNNIAVSLHGDNYQNHWVVTL